jgi:hypothetical protein
MAKKIIKSKKYISKNAPSANYNPATKAQGLSFFNNFWTLSFLLESICLIFYSNTFRNGYSVDDFLVIYKNEKTILELNNLNTSNLPLDIIHLNQGVYFINGITNQSTFVQKIVLSN